MRTSNPLITILPAMPPGIGEIERTRGKGRFVLRVAAILLALIALVAVLMLIGYVSSV